MSSIVNRRRCMAKIDKDVKFIDLGLPSGTLWADRNLGADSPNTKGLYFSFANTEGHHKDEGYDFSYDNYILTKGGTLKQAVQTPVSLEYDAAYALSEGQMKLPSKEQLDELKSYTNIVTYTQNGKLITKLISTINGESIILPNTGYYIGKNLYFADADNPTIALWSGTYWSGLTAIALRKKRTNDYGISASGNNREYGYNIRAIKNK